MKREDFAIDAMIPKIMVTGKDQGSRKSPGDVYVRKQHLTKMRKWFKNGISCVMTKKHKHGKGKKREIKVKKTFHFPKKGYLFPSRKGAKKPFLHYHAVYDHIKRQAPKFLDHLTKSGKNGHQRWPRCGHTQAGQP